MYVWREWEPLIHFTAWIWPGAVASSRLHSGLLSWAGCPGEGHLHQPQTLVKKRAWWEGVRGAEMERCSMVPGKWHVLDLWNLQVEQSNALWRKYLSPFFPSGLETMTPSVVSGWNLKLLLHDRIKVMIGTNPPLQLPTQSLKIGWPAIWDNIFHLISLGWPNTVYLKFIKHSVIPADLWQDLITWYMEVRIHRHLKPARYAESENWTTSPACFNIHTPVECLFWIPFIFTQATPSIFCHFGMTPGVPKSLSLILRRLISNVYWAGASSERNSISVDKCGTRVSVVCERWMDIALALQQKRPRGVTAQGSE